MGAPAAGQQSASGSNSATETHAQSRQSIEEPGRVWLAQIASEVEREIGGRIVNEEEVKALKEGGVGEVRRRMEEGDRVNANATFGRNQDAGIRKRSDADEVGVESLASSHSPPFTPQYSRASSPASISACDSASEPAHYADVKVSAKGSKPKLGEVGWR